MIGFQDLFEAVVYRRRFVIIVSAILFLGIVSIALMLPRQYSAGASILIDLNDNDPASDKQERSLNAQEVDTIVGTQVDILRSTAVLAEVVKKGGMIAEQSGSDENRNVQRAITILRSSLGVATDKGSNVIRLSYTNKNPQVSARIMNLIVDTYLEKQVALRTAPAQNSAKWYDQRTREVRNRYEMAQKKLAEFQRANGIVGVDRMDLEGDKVRTLSSELVKAQADAALANSKSGAVNDPEVAQAGVVQDIQREVSIQAGKVADLSKSIGAYHPDMIAARAQLSELRAALASARAGQASALSSASSSAQRREAELKARLAEQQNRMINMSTVQDQLSVLQRDVDATRQTYDTVRQRYNESELRSEISQANASLLDRATVPAFPSKPSLTLWFAVAVLVAGFGSVGTIAAQEILRPRVRTISGTSALVDTEVIMDMTQPARHSTFGHGRGEYA